MRRDAIQIVLMKFSNSESDAPLPQSLSRNLPRFGIAVFEYGHDGRMTHSIGYRHRAG